MLGEESELSVTPSSYVTNLVIHILTRFVGVYESVRREYEDDAPS